MIWEGDHEYLVSKVLDRNENDLFQYEYAVSESTLRD
jgi:hypothetical protein